jgi:UPF0755 protein
VTLLVVGVLACGGLTACGADAGEGPVQRFRVPQGATFNAVADSLEAHGIVDAPRLFRLYARATGAVDDVQAGTYEFREGEGWRAVLRDLTEGNIAYDRITVPEGAEVRHIAPRVAELTGLPADSVTAWMLDSATAARFDVPGPNLEGYLYPSTYTIPAGSDLDGLVAPMIREYRQLWTPEREARADSIGYNRREITTLASIVEREALIADEMPTIAAVFLNRLEINYRLQADPTVQYARGEHEARLLFAHIDEVEDNPYNTYTHGGIPPGPIGAPSARAIDAVLHPADVNYLYFVARPDGTHEFNRNLVDHNRSVARIRREARTQRDSSGDGP